MGLTGKRKSSALNVRWCLQAGNLTADSGET
jgi:hypothetical protein